MLAEDLADAVKDGHDEASDDQRDLDHLELRPVPGRQKRRIECSGTPAVFPGRLENRAEEELDVVRRLAPASTVQLTAARVPPPMRRARRPDDKLAGSGKLLWPVQRLIAKASADDLNHFVLKMMYVHRGTGARLGDALSFRAFASRSVRDAGKGESLTVPVVDGVRILLHGQRRPANAEYSIVDAA